MFGCRVMLANVCVSYNCCTRQQPALHPHFHGTVAGPAHRRFQGRQVSRKGSQGWKQLNSSTAQQQVSLGTTETGDK